MKYLSIPLFFISHSQLLAGGIVPVTGAQAWGMGGTSVCASDVWSVSNNQAAMAFETKPQCGVFMQNRYGVQGAGLSNLSVLLPAGHVRYGTSFIYFGNGSYHEQKLGAAMAVKISKSFSVGVAGNYQSVGIAQYGNRHMITIEGGVITRLSDNLDIGFHVYNPLRAKLSDFTDERLSVCYRLGLGYTVSKVLRLTAEVIKTDGFRTDICTGIRYTLKDKFQLMAGVSTTRPQLGFGIGYLTKTRCLQVSNAYHPYLGFSTQISMSMSLGSGSSAK